jgi:ankyrin repeat protein
MQSPQLNGVPYGITRDGRFVAPSSPPMSPSSQSRPVTPPCSPPPTGRPQLPTPPGSPDRSTYHVSGVTQLAYVSLTMQDVLGNTLLHQAVVSNDVESVKYILEVERRREEDELEEGRRRERIDARKEVDLQNPRTAKAKSAAVFRGNVMSRAPILSIGNVRGVQDHSSNSLGNSNAVGWLSDEEEGVVRELRDMGQAVLERARRHVDEYAKKEINAPTLYFKINSCVEGSQKEKRELIDRIIALHPEGTVIERDAKQALVDYACEMIRTHGKLKRMEPLDLNAENKIGDTPLIAGAQKGSNESIEVLVELPGVDLLRQNRTGCTALIVAAMLDLVPTCKLLVQAHLKRFMPITGQNESGYSALHWACVNGNATLTELFLKSGAADTLDSSRTDWKQDWRLPIHKCAEYGRLGCMKCLVKHGARLKAHDRSGLHPSHIAAKMGHVRILKYLVEKKVNIFAKDNASKRIPLQFAIEAEKLTAVAYLHECASEKHLKVLSRPEVTKLERLLREAKRMEDDEGLPWYKTLVISLFGRGMCALDTTEGEGGASGDEDNESDGDDGTPVAG